MENMKNLPSGTIVKIGSDEIGRTAGPCVGMRNTYRKKVELHYMVEPGFKRSDGQLVFGAQRVRLVAVSRLSIPETV